ncbi:MAG: helix-turn-helix domain-containing protein [Ktedonobacteraceae bacterium]|nr:helix-turn-helix domain-containing protein [Ktedonobacteraceae bacterium]MBA3825801.1 helix-turn-helix domain-containing protein [Ktedonobacterales bacterium]
MQAQEETKQSLPKLLLTIEEAAKALSVSRAFFYPLVMRGEIFSVKIETARRIPWESLQAYVRKLIDEQEKH